MAVQQLTTANSISSPSLYTGPTAPADNRTQYTGTIAGTPDPTSTVAQGPNTNGQAPSTELAGQSGMSGYPSMSPQQAYNTTNFYYGDAPGQSSTPGAAASTSGIGNPMTDTYNGGGYTSLDMTPGQHGTADARYTTLGGVGPGAPVAQNLANNYDLQAMAAAQRAAPQIQTGAVNMIAGGAGASLGQANGTDLLGLANAGNLAATATGPAAAGQMNAANALYGSAGGQSVIGGMNTAGQLANAANGPGVTGQMLAGNLLGQAAYGDAYQGVMGAGNQLQGIANQGGLNTGQQLLQAAYGPGVSQQNGLALQMNGAAYSPNITNQQQLAGALTGTAGAQQIAQQNALANQLAGSAYGPAVANQAALANQLAAIGQMPAGPSVAQQQLKMGADAAMQQQMAMASAARGGNTALALQNAGANQGAIMGQLNQQQALLRAQEDMANRQLAAQTAQGAAGLYGNIQGQQAAALQGAAGLYGNTLGQQQQAYNAAANLYGNTQGQQLAALQGSAGTYGNAAQLQGQLLGAASQTDLANRGLQVSAAQGAGGLYGNAGSLQGSLLGAAGSQYGNAGQLQGSLLGAANQGYTSTGQLQGSLLGAANQAYAGAAGTQQAAYGNAGQLLQGIAGNQVAQANTQAGVANTYADLAKSQAGLQAAQTAQNDQTSLALQGQAYQTLADQRNAEMNLVNQNIQSQNTRYGIEQGVAINQANLNQQASQANMAAGLSAGGAVLSMLPLLAASDIRSKTQIAPASGEVADAFRPLTSSSYLYKDPNAPGSAPGTQYGPMAQQLEQTPAGATAVAQMANGKKGIDTGRLALLNASATGDMMRRLDKVEAQAGQIQGTQVPMPSLYGAPAQPMAAPMAVHPTRAPMVTQLPEAAPAPIAASRAPMVMSTPTPGASFARYGTPDFDYGGMPNGAPATVNIPTVAQYSAGLTANKKQADLAASSPFGWYVPPAKSEAAAPSLYGGE